MAQLVEYDLAKVGVAGSNPVCRSKEAPDISAEMQVLFRSAPGGVRFLRMKVPNLSGAENGWLWAVIFGNNDHLQGFLVKAFYAILRTDQKSICGLRPAEGPELMEQGKIQGDKDGAARQANGLSDQADQ